MDRRSRGALCVTAMLGAVLLVACSTGSGSPGPPSADVPATSSTVRSSPPPSPSAPTLPDAAKQPTRPGAEAFFRYFIDVYTFTFTSQDTTLMRSISDPSCKFCSSTIQDTQAAVAEGHRIRGGGGQVTYVVAAPGEPTAGLLVNATVAQRAMSMVDSSGRMIQSATAAAPVRMDAAVRWIDGRWRMMALHVYVEGPK